MSYLNPGGFYSMGNKIRATWDMVMSLQFDLADAEFFGATDAEIAALTEFLSQLRRAFAENRGFTTPQPLCGMSIGIDAARDKAGQRDRLQQADRGADRRALGLGRGDLRGGDAGRKRATIYGARTDGAGGSVTQFPVGVYMESYLDYAQSILTRKNAIDSAASFPTRRTSRTSACGRIGGRLHDDGDLLNQGKPFVDRFTQALLDRIQVGAKVGQRWVRVAGLGSILGGFV